MGPTEVDIRLAECVTRFCERLSVESTELFRHPNEVITQKKRPPKRFRPEASL